MTPRGFFMGRHHMRDRAGESRVWGLAAPRKSCRLCAFPRPRTIEPWAGRLGPPLRFALYRYLPALALGNIVLLDGPLERLLGVPRRDREQHALGTPAAKPVDAPARLVDFAGLFHFCGQGADTLMSLLTNVHLSTHNQLKVHGSLVSALGLEPRTY
jgi:hypothetical protein